MPASAKSSLYFAGKNFFTKLLKYLGDPIGRFEYSPDLLTFAKTVKAKRVNQSVTGILVTGDHQICSEILKSSEWLSRPFAERLYLGPTKYDAKVIHPFLDSIIAIDGQDQRRIKKVMHAAFSSAELNRWRDSSERHTKELIQKLGQQKEFDFVSSFANPMPLAVICELIGVPEENQVDCMRWGRTLAGIGLDLPKNNAELTLLEIASEELVKLISELLDKRKLKPEADLLSVMLTARSEGEVLSDKEIIASAAFTLIAGFETTMNLLSWGTKYLIEHPGQLQLLKSKPELMPNFIEEALRLSSPIQFVVRTATTAQLLADGSKVKPGQTVILNLAAANRDSRVFANPDSFDIERENARKNVAFGFGAHHCIGSQLARVEAHAFWTSLLDSFPNVQNWQLTGESAYHKGKLIRSLASLPMTFGV